ncbi:Vitamin B6 photo-protection and homoeostasis [Lotmaria passim]
MQCTLTTHRTQLRLSHGNLCRISASRRAAPTGSSATGVRRCLSLLDLYHCTNSFFFTSERFTSGQGLSRNEKGSSSSSSSARAAIVNSQEPRRASARENGSNLNSSSSSFSCTSASANESNTPSCHTSTNPGTRFSQGLTDFYWRENETNKGVFQPAVLHRETISNRIRLFGMPKGYPATTAVGFRRFFYLMQVNSFTADFSACIGYQSLLSGFFLASSPQMWMLKDLFPALIAAYMANRLVSYESRPKQWFCVSVLLRNLTIISDMVIPSAVPNHMVLAAVVSAVLKQSSALMFFITRAAALQHYAIDNNLAELTKKFNSFSMVTFTLATALAIVYCSFLTSFTAQLTTILVCCVANMTLSYMAYYPIAFRILNPRTMQVLLHAYVTQSGRVMTPQEVSDLMGIRMSPVSAIVAGDHAKVDLATHLLYISPPIDKLLIRSDRIMDDLLYLHSSGSFLLALWRPSDVPLSLRELWRRYELPSLPRFLRKVSRWSWRGRSRAAAAVETVFRGHRLCLLVQHQCTPQDLVTAYLIMYTAILQHATTEEALRVFIQECHAKQEVWDAKGKELYEELRAVNWDVDLPALDHRDFRVSQLLVQKHATNNSEAAPTLSSDT